MIENNKITLNIYSNRKLNEDETNTLIGCIKSRLEGYHVEPKDFPNNLDMRLTFDKINLRKKKLERILNKV